MFLLECWHVFTKLCDVSFCKTVIQISGTFFHQPLKHKFLSSLPSAKHDSTTYPAFCLYCAVMQLIAREKFCVYLFYRILYFLRKVWCCHSVVAEDLTRQGYDAVSLGECHFSCIALPWRWSFKMAGTIRLKAHRRIPEALNIHVSLTVWFALVDSCNTYALVEWNICDLC